MSTLKETLGQLTLGAVIGGTLSALFSEELRTRLDLLPRVLVRLAARNLPGDMRADRVEEWDAELAAITGEAQGLPLTRFLRGLRFGLSLFVHTGALTSALTDRPRLVLTFTAGRRSLAALFHTAGACYCFLNAGA